METENILTIFNVIQAYIDKYGDIEAITEYYRVNGTYSGIAKYLLSNFDCGRDINRCNDPSGLQQKKKQ